MSKQQINPEIVESDEEKFNRLMVEAGFVKKEQAQLTPEARVARLVQLEEALKAAKAIKDLPAAKKIRRQMRKLNFFRSKMMKVEIA